MGIMVGRMEERELRKKEKKKKEPALNEGKSKKHEKTCTCFHI